MTDEEFQKQAVTCLARVARWADRVNDEGLDAMTTDGLVALEFDDGAKYVLNRQGGSRQMWFAAGARAWHYDWDGTAWVDDRDRHPLDARIVEVVAAKLGHPLPPID